MPVTARVTWVGSGGFTIPQALEGPITTPHGGLVSGRPRRRGNGYPVVIHSGRVGDLLDIDALDDENPFEVDKQAAHLFEHAGLGVDDVDVWRSDPLFYPARPPAHWLMVSEVAGQVLVVPLAPSDSGDSSRCRPIGCYRAADRLAARYPGDR